MTIDHVGMPVRDPFVTVPVTMSTVTGKRLLVTMVDLIGCVMQVVMTVMVFVLQFLMRMRDLQRIRHRINAPCNDRRQRRYRAQHQKSLGQPEVCTYVSGQWIADQPTEVRQGKIGREECGAV